MRRRDHNFKLFIHLLDTQHPLRNVDDVRQAYTRNRKRSAILLLFLARLVADCSELFDLPLHVVRVLRACCIWHVACGMQRLVHVALFTENWSVLRILLTLFAACGDRMDSIAHGRDLHALCSRHRPVGLALMPSPQAAAHSVPVRRKQ